MSKITIVLSTLIFFSNPLERIETKNYKVPEISIEIVDKCYIIKEPFLVKNIIPGKEGTAVVIESQNKDEYVIPGLQKVYVRKGKRYEQNQKLGKDFSLNDMTTKFLLVGYSELNKFPQFINNKLFFTVDSGTYVFSITDGVIEFHGYSINKGVNIIARSNLDPSFYFEYWNLSRIIKGTPEKIMENDLIACTGNTGMSLYPHLVFYIRSSDNYDDFKVIYLKAKRNDIH